MSQRYRTGRNAAVNVTWPVELLPPGHVEHFPVDSHEDPRVLQSVVRPQLRQREVSLFQPGQPLLRHDDLRLFVSAEDFVDEEQAEAEQGQVQRGREDLLENSARSELASLRFSHVDFSLWSPSVCARWVGLAELMYHDPVTDTTNRLPHTHQLFTTI